MLPAARARGIPDTVTTELFTSAAIGARLAYVANHLGDFDNPSSGSRSGTVGSRCSAESSAPSSPRCPRCVATTWTSGGSWTPPPSASPSVSRFKQLNRGDLRVVRVAADPSVSVMPATHINDLVGRVAATDLVQGSLLSDAQLLAKGRRAVREMTPREVVEK